MQTENREISRRGFPEIRDGAGSEWEKLLLRAGYVLERYLYFRALFFTIPIFAYIRYLSKKLTHLKQAFSPSKALYRCFIDNKNKNKKNNNCITKPFI